MSFNIKPGIGAHQSSVSGYSGNKIPVGESFHMRNSGSADQLGDPARKSYNEAPTDVTGKEDKNSI